MYSKKFDTLHCSDQVGYFWTWKNSHIISNFEIFILILNKKKIDYNEFNLVVTDVCYWNLVIKANCWNLGPAQVSVP